MNQVTSPKCVEGLRAVKHEDNDNQQTVATQIYQSVSSQTTQLATTSASAGKMCVTTSLMTSSSSDKLHGQHCVYCGQSFKSKGELERHVKSMHVMPTTSQKCNICDEVFASAAVLAQHKLTHCKVSTSSSS